VKNKLILVTSDFFNGKGLTDPFICPELKFLIDKYDVTVISTENKKIKKNEVITEYGFYSLPKYGLLKKVFGVINVIFSAIVKKEVEKIRAENKYTIKLNLYVAHLVARANLLYKFILRKGLISESESILLYAYWYSPAIVLAFTQLKTKNEKIKIISRVHGFEIYEFMNDYNYLPYMDIMLKEIRTIYFISDNAMKYFKNRYSLSDDKCKLSRLGINNIFGRGNPSIDGICRIASCSYLNQNKNVHKIIDAISLINSINVEWVHFGFGPLFKSLTALAYERLGGKSNVKYSFPGRLTSEEIKEYYSNIYIELFINVSTFEGIPVSIMEAMSSSIPVLATNVGGTSEIVNNENGELVDKDISSEELAKRIERFASKENNEKIIMRESAYQTWKNTFNAESNHLKFANEISKNFEQY
jgi:glycosyltransferase involved in cell wall biosynthesis